MDGAPAEPAAAIAAQDPGRPLPSERSHSTTPIQRRPHNRAATGAGQRAMRHFLRRTAVLPRRAPLAFAIAPLTLRMHVTAAPAVLVTAAGTSQGPPARRLPAVPGAVDIAAIAAAAENDLSTAGNAAEPAAGVIHGGGIPLGRIFACPLPGIGQRRRPPNAGSTSTLLRVEIEVSIQPLTSSLHAGRNLKSDAQPEGVGRPQRFRRAQPTTPRPSRQPRDQRPSAKPRWHQSVCSETVITWQ